MEIPLFQQAVNALSTGNHTDGVRMLSQVQQSPNLMESLIQHVLLGTSPYSFSSAGEGGFHAHYYALRLLSSAVVTEWQTKQSTKVSELFGFLSTYINVHVVSYSSHQRLDKSLVAETSSLWAVLWKLRLAEVVHNATEGTTEISSPINSIHETFLEMRADVKRILDMSIRHASEPTNGENALLYYGISCVIALIEEFGLYHKESLRRGVTIGTHERLRHYFKKEILADILQTTLYFMETATRTFSSLSPSVGEIHWSDSCTVLCVAGQLLYCTLIWKFEEICFMNGSVTQAGSTVGANSVPDILNITVDNSSIDEQDSWRRIFEKRSTTGTIPAHSTIWVFEVICKALSATFGALKCIVVKNQYYDDKLKTIAVDLLKSFVQLCSVRCDFWDPIGRAQYAAEGWRIASQLCTGDIWACSNVLNSASYSSTDPATCPPIKELIISASYAFYRIVHSIGTTDGIFYHTDIGNVFITPLRHVSLFLIGKLKKSTIESIQAKINHIDDYDSNEEEILEAFDHVLRTWLEIVRKGLHDVSKRIMLPEQVVTQIGNEASEVLRFFLKTKIEIHGEIAEAMGKLAASGAEDAETSHALEYGNSNTQLMAIIGRDQCELVSGYLLSSFRDLSRVLLNDYLAPDRPSPIALQEAIWYVLSIIAEFIADAPDSERPCIPMPVISYALDCERRYPNTEDEVSRITANTFFSLCGEVFQFIETIIPYLTDGYLASGRVSPAIVESLLEVLRRYIGTYLFADESLQADYCDVFNVVFEGGASVARVAFKLAAQCLSCGFSQDPDVVKKVMSLLQASISLPNQFAIWANSEGIVDVFVTILRNSCPVRDASSVGSTSTLSGVNRGRLLGFIISIISGMSSDVIDAAVDAAGGCWFSSDTDVDYSTIECPIKGFIVFFVAGQLAEQLRTAISGTQVFPSSVVIDIIKTVQGGVEGFKQQNATRIAFVAGYEELLNLSAKAAITVHQREKDKRVLVAALECLDTVVELIGMFLSDRTFLVIIETSIKLTQYIHFVMNESRNLCCHLSSEELRNQEEDERILLLSATAKLVLTVATWGSMNDSTDARTDTVSQLVVKGLLTVLQFMDESNSLIPELRNVVFKALKEVMFSHIGTLIMIDNTQFACVLSAVEFAAASGVPELVNTSLYIMKVFAGYYRRHSGDSQVAALLPITAHFFQRLVRMCLREAMDPDVLPAVAAALQELFAIHGEETLHTLLDQESAAFPLTRPTANILKGSVSLMGFTSTRKEVSSAFMEAVERCVTTAQCARVIE